MKNQYTILSTKIVPPYIKSTTLRRKRLDDLFMQVIDYPVTILQAEAGYGKSTTLVAHLCTKFDHVAWYSIEEEERDAFIFLTYFIYALQTIEPQIGERSLRLLEEESLTSNMLQPCLTLLINDLVERAPDPTLLVLDDFHLIAGVQEIGYVMNFFLRYLPAHVHLVIGSRKAVELEGIRNRKATFDLLLVGKEDLAFTIDEMELLFHHSYGIEIERKQLQNLYDLTEGWVIALQMVWKSHELGVNLRDSGAYSSRDGGVFSYLAREVFDLQSAEIREFLSSTYLITRMDAEICDLLYPAGGSEILLHTLEKSGLFVARVGDNHYRYHRLFQKFLQQHARSIFPELREEDLHQKAASFYEERGQLELSLYHFEQAKEDSNIVRILLENGAEWIRNGRLELMKRYIDFLLKQTLEVHPRLLFWRGEIDRSLSRFQEAIHWYTLAEGGFIRLEDVLGRSQVYVGHAQLYLDTIQPNKALYWLQKAVGVLGEEYPAETAKLLRLQAENYTNSGYLQQAESMIQEASLLAPKPLTDELDIRISLRSGRLNKARQETLAVMQRESLDGIGAKRVARAHREMTLLLSLIDAFLGDGSSSQWHAERGIEMGAKLNSPFVEVVGYIRLGHAYTLQDQYAKAKTSYLESIRLSQELRVERAKVEALMGLAMTSGLAGQLEQAESYAREGLELSQSVQDFWCANLIRLSLGAIWTSYGHDEEALQWLEEAEIGFTQCADVYCLANVRLWLSILYLRLKLPERFEESMTALMKQVEEGQVYNLFEKRTLFGPIDRQMCVPALLEARDRLKLRPARQILSQMGIGMIQKHPGYTLRIYTLGKFTVYRGFEEVERKEWKREKSRQLFQLFVTRQGKWLQRDEICEWLWPDATEEVAHRDFKVAMNALTNAIEPSREARSESFFIERMDTAYRLVKSAAVWIDAVEFTGLAEKRLALAEKGLGGVELQQVCHQFETALYLYQGDYLLHDPYFEWCQESREILRTLQIRMLEALANLYAELGRITNAISCAERILMSDPTWEAAYRILMTCHHVEGNRNLVIAAYQKCTVELEQQLKLPPLAVTTQLYQRLIRR